MKENFFFFNAGYIILLQILRNITDDSTADNYTCLIRIHASLHHLSCRIGFMLNGTPCAMLQISCMLFFH